MKGSVKDSMKALVLLTLFISTSLTLDRVWAQFKVPALIGPVVDQAKVISYDDERNAETIIRKLYDSGQAQLVLVTLPSLEGQTIEQVGIQIADQWKLGTSERDNGILLIASVQDRAVRIEVGQGLEGTIPDATANRIIEDVIIPAIQSSGLSSGLLTGVSSIAKQIDPNFFPETSFYQKGGSATKGPGSIFSFVAMIILILIFRFLGFFSRGRRGRSRFRGGFGGSSGGFRGGFGGGGFGGGGGGFSGGGASGRW